MSNIYSFFGLPNPTQAESEVHGEETSDSQSSEISNQEIIDVNFKKSEYNSEVIIDGEFHDLGETKWQKWTQSRLELPRRAIRYVEPDALHRIPTHGISKRLVNGDMVVVDLRNLLHMKAQQDACRRELGGMSERLGAPIFALDEQETLLLVPGAGAVVDTDSHHLGIKE